MSNKFTDFILLASPASPVLPLMHTTDGYSFRDIISNDELQPQRCTIFKTEDLIYLFYGRPAYRVGAGVESTSFNMYYPVCFLLDSMYLKNATRVFPFDSGAFSNNLFQNYLHKKMTIDNFRVDPNPMSPGGTPIPETPARIVSSFYGTNKKYYYGIAKDSIDLTPLDFEAEVFFELIRTKHKTSHDDRGFSIEIQINHPIPLSHENVKAVVLPNSFFENDSVKDVILNKWQAVPLNYDTFHSNPSVFTMVVLKKVDDYFKMENLYG